MPGFSERLPVARSLHNTPSGYAIPRCPSTEEPSMRPTTFPAFAVALVALFLALPALAQLEPQEPPAKINQEGLVVDAFGFPVDTGEDQVDLTFRLYDSAEEGAPFWTETHSVTINSGYYAVVLGSETELTLAALNREEVWLSVQIGADPEMSPRQRMVSVPYAMRAAEAVNATGHIEPLSVTTGGDITGGTGHMSNFTVSALLETEEIDVSGNARIHGNLDLDGTFSGNLADNTVQAADIADRQVTEPKVADNAITERAVATGAITEDEIRNQTIVFGDLSQELIDMIEEGTGGGGGPEGFRINAERLNGMTSDQFVRSDLADVLDGGSYTFMGRIIASAGQTGDGHGISFMGDTSEAIVALDSQAAGSTFRVGNLGGGGDELSLETQGGRIWLQGGTVTTTHGATVGQDLQVGGNLTGAGAGQFGGAGAFGGNLNVGGAATVGGVALLQSDTVVGGSLVVAEDVEVTGQFYGAGSGVFEGVLAGNSGVYANAGQIVAQAGGVEAAEDVLAGRDVIAGRDIIGGRAIVPKPGSGGAGIVFPTPAFDNNGRAWLQYYAEAGSAGIAELGVGQDGDDVVRLAAGGGTQIRSVNPTDLPQGGDLDVGRRLIVRGTSEFRNDMSVDGMVSAWQLAAGELFVDNQVTVDNVLVAQELTVLDRAVVEGSLWAASISGALGSNMVDSGTIINNSVGPDDLAATAVHSGNILDGGIASVDLANNSVTSDKIANATILGADIAPNAITAAKIADDQILTRHIKDGQVGTGDLAGNAVTTAKIADLQVKTADIGNGAVTTAKLAGNAVTSAVIADGTIANADIAVDAVTGDRIKNGSVSGADIADQSIGNADLATNAVDARVLANNSVGSGHLQDGGVRRDDIASNAINAAKVADGSLGGADIANGSIASADIADNSLGGVDIQNGSIANADLGANSVTTDKIANGTITEDDMGFDIGGGGSGIISGGNVVFPNNNQGNIWRHGENGEEDWFLRREGEDLVLRETEDSNRIMWRVVDNSGTHSPYGFNASTTGAGGYRIDDSHVIQGDRDFFGKRMFVTGTSYDEGGAPASNAVVFPKHSSGQRPYVGTVPTANLMVVKSGSSGSDQMTIQARNLVKVDGALEVLVKSRDGDAYDSPIFAVYGNDQTTRGWKPGHQAYVFTAYGDPPHTNENSEKIILGRQPDWQGRAGGGFFGTWRWSNFDNGDRNQHSGGSTSEWWEYDGHGRRYQELHWGTDGSHAPEQVSGTGGNSRSRYQRGIARAQAIKRWRGSWDRANNGQRWCPWNYCWDRRMISSMYVGTYFQWNMNGLPAGAILARGQIWYRFRSQVGLTRRARSEYYGGHYGQASLDVYLFGRSGTRHKHSEVHGCCTGRDTGWRKVNLTTGDLLGVVIENVRVDGKSWAGQNRSTWRGQWRGWGHRMPGRARRNWPQGKWMFYQVTTSHEVWLDTFSIEFMSSRLSEMQVYADATFWGAVHIKGDLKVLGQKNFIQPHPEDPNKEVAYVSLEGGESGTYWRGSSRLSDGKAEIQLPEHFVLVTAEEGLTATATLREPGPAVYVDELSNSKLVLRTGDGSKSNARFDFIVMGVRKGFENHVPIRYRNPAAERQAAQAAADPTMGLGGPEVANASYTP